MGGKSMDINLYTVEVYQRGGPGVLTYNVGKEEVGIADIKVENWPLVDSTSFEAPFAQLQCCIDDGSDARCVGVGDRVHSAIQRPIAVFPQAVLENRHCSSHWRLPACLCHVA